ncbi:MAG TPA: hypothetical protein VFW65_36520 [Pseudonocardiaceae bacterium]|nr:hypothetical protein [Pseudonocardiaceae bacterium]
MATTTVAAAPESGTASRWYTKSTVLAGASITMIGATHIAAGLQALSVSVAYSVFFFVTAPLLLLYGLVLLGKVPSAKNTGMLMTVVVGTLALIGLWLFAHIGWQPLFQPSDGPEALSELNVFAFGLELLAAISVMVMLPKRNNLRRNTTCTVLGLAVLGWLTLLVIGFF